MTTPHRRGSVPALASSEEDEAMFAELVERGNAVLASPGLEEMWQQMLSSPGLLELEHKLEVLSGVLGRAAERDPEDHEGREADAKTFRELCAWFGEPLIL